VTTAAPKPPASTTTTAPRPAVDAEALFPQIFGDIQTAMQTFYRTGDLIAYDRALGRIVSNYNYANARISVDPIATNTTYTVTIGSASRCMSEDLSRDPVLVAGC
jgi:hypothetical protein